MLLDKLANWQLYAACHPAFSQAFAYLADSDFIAKAEGRYTIDGDRVYAIVQDCEGRGVEGAKLEGHRKYIDIQFVVSGDEFMGWSDTADIVGQGYDAEKDVEFFTGDCQTWVDVPPDHFAVFFPSDGHAPLAATGPCRKVVVKVEVE